MSLGTVLVIGGCGCLGSHIVEQLLELDSPEPISIHAASRKVSKNRFPGVTYHSVDITSIESVHRLFQAIQPKVVFHTSAPSSLDNNEGFHYAVNVTGTRNLLQCSMAAHSVEAFIYTSSINVHAGYTFHNADETWPLNTWKSSADNYSKTKAIADVAVLQANRNDAKLRTVSLRVATIYGERDSQFTATTVEALNLNQQRFQIGDGSNLYDFVSVANAARAHILAAKALVSNKPGVAGEAFLITDGNPVPFLDDAEGRFGLPQGDKTTISEVTIIPGWFMIALATAVEWLAWIFTVGRVRPRTMRKFVMQCACSERTFTIKKARERLGYNPADDMEENVIEAAEWALKQKVS